MRSQYILANNDSPDTIIVKIEDYSVILIGTENA